MRSGWRSPLAWVDGRRGFSSLLVDLPGPRPHTAMMGRPLHGCLMEPQQNRRPSWLNWLILAAFLWSSWQLAGLWVARLHG